MNSTYNLEKEGVSVVVCCYNSEQRLPETLRCIAVQEIEGVPWEVIVVDNASRDNTRQVAENTWQKEGQNIDFRVISEEKPGLMNAREKGLEEAGYDIICFVDDDNRLQHDYVQLAQVIMTSDRKIAALGGGGEPDFEEGEKPWWFDDFENAYAVGRQAEQSGDVSETKQFVYGAGILIRKSYWQQVKQANFKSMLLGRTGEQLSSGEEVEMCHAFLYLGCRIWYDERLHFKHLISAKRLSWQFIKDNHRGFGKTFHITHAYKFFQKHDYLPDLYLRLPLWLDRILHTLQVIADNQKGVWQLLTGNDEGSPEAINVLMYWEEVKMLFGNRKNLNGIYKEIYELKKRLEEIKDQESQQSSAY